MTYSVLVQLLTVFITSAPSLHDDGMTCLYLLCTLCMQWWTGVRYDIKPGQRSVTVQLDTTTAGVLPAGRLADVLCAAAGVASAAALCRDKRLLAAAEQDVKGAKVSSSSMQRQQGRWCACHRRKFEVTMYKTTIVVSINVAAWRSWHCVMHVHVSQHLICWLCLISPFVQHVSVPLRAGLCRPPARRARQRVGPGRPHP
jgi:hypothetical protein